MRDGLLRTTRDTESVWARGEDAAVLLKNFEQLLRGSIFKQNVVPLRPLCGGQPAEP